MGNSTDAVSVLRPSIFLFITQPNKSTLTAKMFWIYAESSKDIFRKVSKAYSRNRRPCFLGFQLQLHQTDLIFIINTTNLRNRFEFFINKTKILEAVDCSSTRSSCDFRLCCRKVLPKQTLRRLQGYNTPKILTTLLQAAVQSVKITVLLAYFNSV